MGAVCLPAEEQDFPKGSQCWVSGWGHTDPSHSESAPRALAANGCGDVGWGILPKERHLHLPPATFQCQSTCVWEFYSSSLPAPKSDRPLPPCAGSTAHILGSLLWVSVSLGPLTTSLLAALPSWALLCALWLCCVPPSLCLPPAAHSSDTLQDTVVPLLSTKLCNSSCVYSGALTPRMLCAGYLDGRADACQVWQGGGHGGGGSSGPAVAWPLV